MNKSMFLNFEAKANELKKDTDSDSDEIVRMGRDLDKSIHTSLLAWNTPIEYNAENIPMTPIYH